MTYKNDRIKPITGMTADEIVESFKYVVLTKDKKIQDILTGEKVESIEMNKAFQLGDSVARIDLK